MALIEVLKANKRFGKTVALDDVSFDIARGEMVALVGPSGSGKSTLIRAIACLETLDKHETDDNGSSLRLFDTEVQSGGRILSSMKAIRRKVGVVFQSFNLVGRLSVEMNVLTGLLGQVPRWRGTFGLFNRSERELALMALNRVGIMGQSRQRASTLSGGQQQRAAIARALVQKSEIIMADEPVASLDPAAADRVMGTLARINEEDGATVLVSLHQIEYALKYCQRIIALKDGALLYDGRSADTTQDFFTELYGREIDLDDDKA